MTVKKRDATHIRYTYSSRAHSNIFIYDIDPSRERDY